MFDMKKKKSFPYKKKENRRLFFANPCNSEIFKISISSKISSISILTELTFTHKFSLDGLSLLNGLIYE